MSLEAPVGSGTLWVVATPIGNLQDLSARAADLLASVPVIAAEDTRVSARLLGHRAQPPQMVALNEHTERRQIGRLLATLGEGHDVALLSDAGTPLISDPGFRLVRATHEAGFRVSPVPGPCAAIAGLSVAGLASDRFWFEGFLPAKTAARRSRLQSLATLPVTLIVYVPARDLVAVLEDCIAVLGADRIAALGREMTKLHETVHRAPLADLAAFCRDDPDQLRGEAILLLSGCRDDALAAVDPLALARELAGELAPSRAAGILARLTGLSRKQAFALIERIRGDERSPADG
ncbi:16S rRNA (cytidine(1402)-2'-O)-methyltransferase [Wenzhouxiangella limi]|uniref:Ribosomal RNA small subunit methyltransferase I n=1 Tax=Wenzhouxiangella limi TaxID=2707351 RepID=A0A845V289_9GAMM|nr:16S rRNA (cytidine(1402)-2'-O)-methyltransferase [Wenzhouxiangella limi]NDY96380.1 16S rRNA (cytidine(1402)-2'-O)-methyltransferase [Wenzhouxiangella limi]